MGVIDEHFAASQFLQQNDKELEAIVAQILLEVSRAVKKHPQFPEDLIHGAAIVGEEAGELLRACLLLKYETDEKNYPAFVEAGAGVYSEAVQTAASAIRFLLTLKDKI